MLSPAPVTCPDLSAQSGICHGFFTRHGGVSTGVYDSLNCAYGTGDNPEHVEENYRRITSLLGIKPHHLCKAYQVHSATVITTETAWARDSAPQADAIVTTTPGLAIGITTADCLPILFADSTKRIVAATHAGWKGAFTGIIEATLEAMCQLGASLPDIHATIGPAIAQASYEVGPEFYDRFSEQGDENKIYFLPSRKPGYHWFDLKAYAKDRLRAAGVSNINMLAHDTCLEVNDFFSYRRTCLQGQTAYGCQLSAIVLEP